MIGAFQQLMLSASIYILCAFALGLVFDRVSGGPWRDAGCGIVVGLVVASLQLAPLELGSFVVDVDTPLLLVATLYGGPVTAAVVLVAPMAAAILTENAAMVADLLALVVPVLIGLTVLAVWSALGWRVDRRAVLVAACLSPLTLVTTLLPFADFDGAALRTLAIWTAVGTVIFGLTVTNEVRRAQRSRIRRKQRLFNALTGTVPASVFQQQLEHQWRLHERYGHEYSYLLVSIDEAQRAQAALNPDEWDRMRAVVATAVTQATRESDVCTAIDLDRFGLLLPHATLPFAVPVARRVQDAVAAAVDKAKPGLKLTVSIGCAEVTGTTAPNDIEAAAEGQLAVAGPKQRRGVIAPAEDTVSDGLVRSFPGAVAAPVSSDAASAGGDASGRMVASIRGTAASPPSPPRAAIDPAPAAPKAEAAEPDTGTDEGMVGRNAAA
ncbi:GGDEF domain-containing protein [Acuticoccus sediminis]|uniref:GGDEF domain-containing protein n=1 Tax=Acuticoccus sediminis TaxID=2184697 RepID=UPI001CFD21EB|nr:GGDEF domain-containing protein [Acuticoccus sediminis]